MMNMFANLFLSKLKLLLFLLLLIGMSCHADNCFAEPSSGDAAPPASNIDIDIKFDQEKNARIPGGENLEKYYDELLCIQIGHPKEWKPVRSSTKPEFIIKSPEIKGMQMLCRRIRIMKGRSFDDEVKAILANEFTGRQVEIEKEFKKPISQYYEMIRIVSYDHFKGTDGKNQKLRNSIYLFIKAGEEISMFFFETPSQYYQKAVPLFENMIKSIKVVKRRDP